MTSAEQNSSNKKSEESINKIEEEKQSPNKAQKMETEIIEDQSEKYLDLNLITRKWRVKFYKLNSLGQWDDIGIGFVFCANKINELNEKINDKIKEINKLNEHIENNNREINKLNKIKTDNEKEISELKQIKTENEDEINKLKEQVNNEDNENKKLSLFLEDAKRTISDKDQEINNLKNYYINQQNLLNKDKEASDKEKLNLKESINILESLVISEKSKFNKLFLLAKNIVDKLNKEKMVLNEEIIKIKNEKENNDNKNEKEKKYNYGIIKENNIYDKKVKRLNKIIEELRNRIEHLYLELSPKQNNQNAFFII